MAKTTEDNKVDAYTAHSTMGIVYYTRGEYARALELILTSKAYQTGPDSVFVLLVLAEVYRQLGTFPSFLPPSIQKWQSSLFILGNTHQMKKTLDSTKNLLSADPFGIMQVARFHAKLRNDHKVEKLLKKLIPSDINKAEADWLAIGSCIYDMLGYEDKAKKFRNRLRELPSTDSLPPAISKVLIQIIHLHPTFSLPSIY